MKLENAEDAWALYRKLKSNLDLQEEQLTASRAALVQMKANLEGLDGLKNQEGKGDSNDES